ncbi:unnamed protein product, partial [Lymnaea stagnalis]
MIQGKDHLMLSGKLSIHGFSTSFNATFGLLTGQNRYSRIATQIESSNCTELSEVKMDTCVCTYLGINELHFRCNVTASCKMAGQLYVYMNFNNIYYYTQLIAILKTH